MIIYQRLPPRRRPGPRRIHRSVAHHLRAFYEPRRSPGRKRYHLASVVIPASAEQAAAFVGRCAEKLAAHGMAKAEIGGLLDGIAGKLARESERQGKEDRIVGEATAGLRSLARRLSRAAAGRRRAGGRP